VLLSATSKDGAEQRRDVQSVQYRIKLGFETKFAGVTRIATPSSLRLPARHLVLSGETAERMRSGQLRSLFGK
jgi:hypothetical protein